MSMLCEEVAVMICMSAHVNGSFDVCDNSEEKGILMINPSVQSDHIKFA